MISINITTTSERLELCSATVWSLIMQGVKPDFINVWVSKESYLSDLGIIKTPEWIDKINSVENIVRLRYTDNIGPYRKIIPILRESSYEDVIIYADDDVIYLSTWLGKLLAMYNSFGGEYPIASRVRIRNKNFLGGYKSYNLSSICYDNRLLKSDFIITGVGGCVVSKKHFLSKDILLDDFLSVAPTTDDIWISKLLTRGGKGVKTCSEALSDVQEILHGNNALNALNITRPIGGKLTRKVHALYLKLAGYLGVNISKNDKSISGVKKYFN